MPLGIKDMTVEEGWEKTNFLNKVDGKLHVKRSHNITFKHKEKWETEVIQKKFLLFGLPRVNPI